MKRPRPGTVARHGGSQGKLDSLRSAQAAVVPIRGTRSRRSAALLSAAAILALVGCSVLVRDMLHIDMGGRYSRMLSSIDESDANERSQEEQAQIDAFYAKYFGGSNPTIEESSTEESMTVASDGAGVIEGSAQGEEDASFNVGNTLEGSTEAILENNEQSDLQNHDETTVIASTDGVKEEEATKVEPGTVTKKNIDSSIAASSETYFVTPFCAPADSSQSASAQQYKCGESADQPSPRTEFSASSREEYNNWSLMAKILERMATKFAERVDKERQTQQMVASTAMATGLRGAALSSDASVNRKRPIIFLGDGIFESYLGTSYGQPSQSSEREAIVQNFAATFSTSKYTPLVQAIEGDMTQHLLYRLQNGALHPAYVSDPTAIYVVLIGTANLSAGHLPQETARGILAIVQQLMDQVAGRVLLLQPLPRGDASTTLASLCPGPRCDKEGQPLPAYKPDLDKVRYALENAMATLTHRYPGRIHMLQKCAQAFWPSEEGRARGEEVNYALMTEDGWHPNAKGHEAIDRCLLDCIEGTVC